MTEDIFLHYTNTKKVKGPSRGDGPSIRIIPPWDSTHRDHSPYVVDLRPPERTINLPESIAPVSLPRKPQQSLGKLIRTGFSTINNSVANGARRSATALVEGVSMSVFTGARVIRLIGESFRQGSGNASDEQSDNPQEPFLPSLRKEIIVFGAVTLAIIIVIHTPAGVRSGIQGVQAQKQEIIDAGSQAIADLTKTQTALQNGNLSEGLQGLSAAQQSFTYLSREFNSPDSWVLKIVGALPLTTRWHEGRDIAQIGGILTGVGQRLVSTAEQVQSPVLSMAKKLELIAEATRESTTELKRAQGLTKGLIGIGGSEQITSALQIAVANMEQFSNVFGALFSAIGEHRLKRYIVVFENSSELRPAGGFMGSFALVDVADGVVKHQEFPKGGSYDLQGSLKLRFVPPEPLSVFRDTWQFHDANWFADWPTTARTLKLMYEHAEGPSVDGVVAITSPVLEKLFEAIGPIIVNGEPLSADTVIDTIQRKVELEYDRKDNAPKKYIEDVAAALQKRLGELKPQEMLPLMQLVSDSIHQKLILAYSDDRELNDRLNTLGALGEVRSTTGDYFSMVSANIGGEKTDRVIDRVVNIESAVSEDGRILNRVHLERTHHGNPGELFYGVKNTEYVRVYVPEGSRLVRAQGFIAAPRLFFGAPSSQALYAEAIQEYPDRIKRHTQWQVVETKEFGKTVFGGWLQLNAGSSQEVELVYELPFAFTNTSPHTLLVQKQPGETHTSIGYSFSPPTGLSVLTALPESLRASSEPSIAIFNQQSLKSDQLYGIIAHLSK